MSYKPEDLMPDDKNYCEVNGKSIRKGSVAAALANAKIVESKNATAAQKKAALEALQQLAPALVDFELTRFMQWKNPEIQKIFDAVESSAQ